MQRWDPATASAVFDAAVLDGDAVVLGVPATDGFARVIEAAILEALEAADPRLEAEACIDAVAGLTRELLALPDRPLRFELVVVTEPSDLYVRVRTTLGGPGPVTIDEDLRAALAGCTSSHAIDQDEDTLLVVLQLDLED